MDFFKMNAVAVIALVIAITGYFHHQSPATPHNVGGTSNVDNLQLTNTGTSTLTRVGCFGGYATSTATPIVFTFNTQATTSIISAFGASAAGMVTWSYGQCGTAPGL